MSSPYGLLLQTAVNTRFLSSWAGPERVFSHNPGLYETHRIYPDDIRPTHDPPSLHETLMIPDQLTKE